MYVVGQVASWQCTTNHIWTVISIRLSATRVIEMDNLIGLPSGREPHGRVWTANKSNLSFPELRGDYRPPCEPRVKSEGGETGIMMSPRSPNGSRYSPCDGLPFTVCRMDLQNAYAVALSAEVYGLLSWLTITAEQLSKVGTFLQHPDHRERLNKVLARTMVEVSIAS